MFSYESMKKNPKFQYWISGNKKVIFDHAKSKNPGIPEHEYTKDLTRARCLLRIDEFNEGIINKMKKHFIGLSIEHTESIIITDIENYENIIFPYFRNNCNI